MYELASGLSLSALYPDYVRIMRVREDLGGIGGETYRHYTKQRPIRMYNYWQEGFLIHELAHYLDFTQGFSKPFQKYVGASTFLWWYSPGDESSPIYNGGLPPNRREDFAESLREYVELYTNRSSDDIGIVPGESRWYFIEAILDTGKPPSDDNETGCIPGLGISAQLANTYFYDEY